MEFKLNKNKVIVLRDKFHRRNFTGVFYLQFCTSLLWGLSDNRHVLRTAKKISHCAISMAAYQELSTETFVFLFLVYSQCEFQRISGANKNAGHNCAENASVSGVSE